MSAIEHENPTTTEETPVVVDLANLSDARIEDIPAFEVARATLLDAAKAAVREAKRYTNATKALAEARVAIRSFIVRSNGFPDWAASSDAYSVAVSTAETPVLAPLGADATRRLNQAVRQHVKRNYLLPGIVSYVLTHAPAGVGDKLADEATRWAAGERDAVLTGPSVTLVSEVRKHYKAAELTLPDGPFSHTQPSTGGSGGPGPASPSSALTSLLSSLEGVKQIVPRYAVMGILSTASAVSRKLLDGKMSDIQDRPMVVRNLQRISTICLVTAKTIEGKADAKDEQSMMEAYFDEATDKISE